MAKKEKGKKEGPPPPAIGACSWCLTPGASHHLEKSPLVSRDLYRCDTCGRQTRRCMMLFCKALARAHDKLCAVHDRTVPRWPAKDGSDRAELLGRTATEERGCSWCFEATRHWLLEKNIVSRNIYECLGCHKRTATCRTCSGAHARAHPLSQPDSQCLACAFNALVPGGGHPEIDHDDDDDDDDDDDGGDGDQSGAIVEAGGGDKPKGEKRKAVRAQTPRDLDRVAWCSWCCDRTRHALEVAAAVTRNVYRCRTCSGRSLPCIVEGCGAMARGGLHYDDRNCAACTFGGSQWEDMRSRKAAAVDAYTRDPNRASRAELGRKSPERERAFAGGLIRPFLLLAAIGPEARIMVASSMGLTLVPRRDVFGDAHKEAWAILSMRGGVRSRTAGVGESIVGHTPAMRRPNWYDTLSRVASACFDAQTAAEAAEGQEEGKGGDADADADPDAAAAGDKKIKGDGDDDGGDGDGDGDSQDEAVPRRKTIADFPALPTRKTVAACCDPKSALVPGLEETVLAMYIRATRTMRRARELEFLQWRNHPMRRADGIAADAFESELPPGDVDETDEADAGDANGNGSEKDGNENGGKVTASSSSSAGPARAKREMTVEEEDEMRELLRRRGVRDTEVQEFYLKVAKSASGVGGLAGVSLSLTTLTAAIPSAAVVTMPTLALLAPLMGPLAILGWSLLGVGALKMALGSSEARLLPCVVTLLNFRVILAIRGIDIATYYGPECGDAEAAKVAEAAVAAENDPQAAREADIADGGGDDGGGDGGGEETGQDEVEKK